MGCVSSALLNHDDEFVQIGGSATFSHHIVSLTSTTYGFLALEPPPTPPPPPAPAPRPESHPSPTTTPTPPRLTLRSLLQSPCTKNEAPEVINSWELMAGLDSTPQQSFRISKFDVKHNKENSNPNIELHSKGNNVVKVLGFSRKCVDGIKYNKLDEYENICPPNGENRVVIYTTTLRGVRKTFEDCNVVRSAIEGFGVSIFERDISMDRGFRDELTELLKCKENSAMIPPRVFIKGKYIGGVEEVVRTFEDGELGELLEGVPRLKAGFVVCGGCGGARFLPCFRCNGSCKMVAIVDDGDRDRVRGRGMVVRCSDCNENGLVQCPICCAS